MFEFQVSKLFNFFMIKKIFNKIFAIYKLNNIYLDRRNRAFVDRFLLILSFCARKQ